MCRTNCSDRGLTHFRFFSLLFSWLSFDLPSVPSRPLKKPLYHRVSHKKKTGPVTTIHFHRNALRDYKYKFTNGTGLLYSLIHSESATILSQRLHHPPSFLWARDNSISFISAPPQLLPTVKTVFSAKPIFHSGIFRSRVTLKARRDKF